MKKLSIVSAFALLIGCGLAATDAVAQQKLIRISTSGADVSTMDPHRATSTTDKPLMGWLFSGLVRFPPGSADPSKLEPDLAEKWETSPDGKVWTFFLRKGVKFHGNWGEVTADDVLYSLQRASSSKSSSFAANYAGVESIEKVDDHTVRITLKYPDANFLGNVANYHGGNIVSKRAAEELKEKFSSNPVGTGPFKLEEHLSQQHVKLAAHNDYFRGAPKLDGVMYRLIPSDSARDLAFTSGELDIVAGKREQRWVNAARKRGNMIVDILRPGEFRTLHLNRTIAPLDNVRVRKAIQLAIDTDAFTKFFGEDVAPKGCSVVPNGYFGEDCSTRSVKFDLAKAKALLAEAGHAEGFTLKVVSANSSSQLAIMEIIQAQLARAGIKIDLQVVDNATYHSLIRKNTSAMVMYGAARFPLADVYLSEFYHSDAIPGKPTGVTNFSHCSVADEEISAARLAPSQDEQKKLWSAAQKKIHDDVCAVPLFELLLPWGRSPRVDYGYELKGSMNLAPPITELTTLK